LSQGAGQILDRFDHDCIVGALGDAQVKVVIGLRVRLQIIRRMAEATRPTMRLISRISSSVAVWQARTPHPVQAIRASTATKDVAVDKHGFQPACMSTVTFRLMMKFPGCGGPPGYR
jgi:hypothetical protein